MLKSQPKIELFNGWDEKANVSHEYSPYYRVTFADNTSVSIHYKAPSNNGTDADREAAHQRAQRIVASESIETMITAVLYGLRLARFTAKRSNRPVEERTFATVMFQRGHEALAKWREAQGARMSEIVMEQSEDAELINKLKGKRSADQAFVEDVVIPKVKRAK